MAEVRFADCTMILNRDKHANRNEIGALSLITRSKIMNAARLVKRGVVYPLAVPISDKGVPQFPKRKPPSRSVSFYKLGNVNVCEDNLSTSTHNQTHIDALAHVWKGSTIFNGFSSRGVTKKRGAKRCSIDKVGPIVTRGVLVDLPYLKHVDHLHRGYAISDDDIRDCLEKEGVQLMVGDALLVRTGWIRTFDTKNPISFFRGDPGLGMRSLSVIDQKKVSVIGSDNYSIEVDPSESKLAIPIHLELIWKRGIHLIELMNLEMLSKDKIFEFMFVTSPLPILGGLGSPVVPLAVT